ncbi:MAG: hypothetical protein ACK4VV_12750 [Pseudomonas sp.]
MVKPFLVALILVSPAVFAQSVQRCVQPDGSVAFTQGGCGAVPSETYRINTAPAPDMPQASTLPQAQQSDESAKPGLRILVVGGSKCPVDMSRTEARRRGVIMQGMSEEQVVAVYGDPDRSAASSSGYNSYTWYSTDSQPYRSVDFDAQGCVTEVFITERHDEQSSRRQPATHTKKTRD